ncbi:NAD(P)/FAD-dependent oxidoreductase [Micromonospora sp. NPDC049101]|uniref:flavin monoamine oxidase family protein n=1 Tax=unclassified Micromonospora TaxID=2617518 RepID=UPI0033C19369
MERFTAGPGRGDVADATIAVLGAGVAGLVAAYELARRGHRVVVLEADSRVGGRIFTHRFGEGAGPVVELGAMRIPGDHELTLRYIDELGLSDQLRPFTNVLTDPDNLLRIGTRFVRARDAADALVRETARSCPGAAHRSDALLFVGWMHAMVRALAPREQRDIMRADLAGLLDVVGGLDVTPFLRDGRADLSAAFRRHPELRAACSGALKGFLDDILRRFSTGMVCLPHGMDQLPNGLASRLPGRIHLRHEVTAIDVRPEGVTVGLATERGRTAVTYPVVLCTLPFSVLRNLPLRGFDADKVETIKRLDYGSATKVGLLCAEAFWNRHRTVGGGSASGGSIRQTYYPAPITDPAGGAALLGSYTIAEDADQLGRLSVEERHRIVVDELTAMHPELRAAGMIQDVVSIAWGERRWSRGCAAVRQGLTGAELEQDAAQAIRAQGGLFFAGEHCSVTPAWIQAGIETALTAVQQIDRFPAVVAEHRSSTALR